MRIDLVLLGAGPAIADWPLGEIHALAATPAALAAFAAPDGAGRLLFWAAELGAPDPQKIREIGARPGEAHHAGLVLGQAARPRLFDFVHPTWMLHRDPPVEISASSWRLSLRALLAPAELWRAAPPRAHYRTLDAAALELGWRWLWRGALLRHQPDLVPAGAPAGGDLLPLADELQILRDTSGRKWTLWATLRAALSRSHGWLALGRAWRELSESGAASGRRPSSTGENRPTVIPATAETPFPSGSGEGDGEPGPGLRGDDRGGGALSSILAPPGVTVLVPTLDRYPYLETLLDQLGAQTHPPREILVVDQTAAARRRHDLESSFPHLPLRVIERDQAGQCSARNAGLAAARGDYILFLDDDDEIPPDLIARHLAGLARSGADAVCGVADEVGAGPLPPEFRRRRLADVFPTNNSLLRRDLLAASGLFDLAYEKGARADADLGHRLYLAGALLVLDPEISVLHHHAPAGGLRQHGARKATFAASRRRLFARHLPEPTEIYLALRYFSRRQVKEALYQRAAGTFAVRGGLFRRLLRAAWALLLLPHTWLRVAGARRRALAMLGEYPRIPFPGDPDPREEAP